MIDTSRECREIALPESSVRRRGFRESLNRVREKSQSGSRNDRKSRVAKRSLVVWRGLAVILWTTNASRRACERPHMKILERGISLLKAC
jgi:hypothetical protein